MGIRNLSENVVLAVLSQKKERSAELVMLNETVSERPECDVVIDFSRVEIVTSADICNLLILHNLLDEHGRRLVLCNVAFATKCIFRVTGLEGIFEFAEDSPAALVAIQG